MHRFTFEMQPDPALIVSARLFVATVARHVGCDDERAEDAKIAVSEACAAALTSNGTAAPIRIDVGAEPERLTVAVTVDATFADDAEHASGVGDPDVPTGLRMITLLFDDARSEPVAGGQRVTFSIPLTSPPRTT